MATLLNLLKSGEMYSDELVVLEDADVKLMQRNLLQMLDDILSVCNENNIKYQLGGGSALGAIRHKGFIPWDDDIDINIERKYIDTFIVAFEKKFKEKYWIHIPGKSDGYDLLMIQILLKSVRAREFLNSNKKECGLCIDIFILENTFDNYLLRNLHGIGCMFFRYVLSCIRFKKNGPEIESIVSKESNLYKYYEKRAFLGSIFMCIPFGIWTSLTQRWLTICKNNNSKYVVIPAGQHQFFKEMYLRSDVCNFRHVEFEKRIVYIAENYDVYLKTLYGDYMKIPPKDKQEKHVLMELDRDALKSNLV